MRSTLPSRSPTTRSSCAAARRRRDTASGYATLPAWPGGTTLHESPDLADRDRTLGRRPHRAHAPRTGGRGAPRARRRARDRSAGTRRAHRARVRVRARSRPRSSPMTSLLDPLRDPDDFARERTVDGVPHVVARGAPSTTRGRSAGGSGASCSGSRCATCSGTADLPGSRDASWPRSPQVCVEAALAIVEPDVPLRGDRHGQARRSGAELRERHRRAVRPRRRRRRGRATPRARCSPR